jgi:D-glycero-D-manno-heptose 1,7-bisphosphate phosphatase
MYKKALFLDRDGVINIDYGYVYKIEDFDFYDGIFDILRYFQKRDYYIFIVTNQSGIARGYYTTKDYKTLTIWMLQKFKQQKININKVVFCPYLTGKRSNCRKPNRGMIDTILNEFDVDLENSIMIGDKPSDIDMAINVGIQKTIYINKKSLNRASLSFDNIDEYKKYLSSS